jgi:hypothetical protein
MGFEFLGGIPASGCLQRAAARNLLPIRGSAFIVKLD